MELFCCLELFFTAFLSRIARTACCLSHSTRNRKILEMHDEAQSVLFLYIRIYITNCIFVIPAKAFARDYGITGVRLSVCLSVCLCVTTITK